MSDPKTEALKRRLNEAMDKIVAKSMKDMFEATPPAGFGLEALISGTSINKVVYDDTADALVHGLVYGNVNPATAAARPRAVADLPYEDPTRWYVMDFETCSTSDLKQTGVKAYAENVETRVLCMAYRDPVSGKTLVFDDDQAITAWLKNVLVIPGAYIVGWNMSFERTIAEEIYGVYLPPERCIDLMAWSAYRGLPLGLDRACQMMGLPEEKWKDKEGHALMLRMSRPRGTNVFGHPTWWDRDDPDKLERLKEYCVSDVEAEYAMGIAMLLERGANAVFPEEEFNTWVWDQKMNERGVRVDLDLVEGLRNRAKELTSDMDKSMCTLTGGAVKSCTQVPALTKWLRVHTKGQIGSCAKGELEAWLYSLAPNVGGAVVDAVKLRLAAAKSSVKKLDKMAITASDECAIPWTHQYYGANRTGRWAGRQIQVQNLTRNVLKEVEQEVFARYPDRVPDLETISRLLRACLIPRDGKAFGVADFAQIEARVIAWLAEQQDVLSVFAKGEDVYQYTSDKLMLGSRQAGKVAVLGLGFGMGGDRFQEHARSYGLTVDSVAAANIVNAWRRANPRIVNLWHALESAFKRAILEPGSVFEAGNWLRIGMDAHGHVRVKLPSGRVLFYRDAELVGGRIMYQDAKYVSKSIDTYGGKLAENVTQAVARDCLRDVALWGAERGMEFVMTVHDELVFEATAGPLCRRQVGELIDRMKETPSWAPGLPMDAAGGVLKRYGKV